MELGTYTPHERGDGDQLAARDAVDRPLIVLVREHRTGIITKFKPEGGDGVLLDVADIATGQVWISILWMNGAIVDGLAPYVGQAVPIKLAWTPSAKGGNPYISLKPLDGAELAAAQAWATANPNRFDAERAQRGQATGHQGPAAPAATAPQPAQPAPAPATPAASPEVAALLAQIGGGTPPPAA